MSSPCPDASAFAAAASLAALAIPAAAGADSAAAAGARVLRVCADPDNLPYSHADGSGFENRIAALLADEIGATLAYAWMPQRRGFVRKTMGEDACDLFVGVPTDFERVLTTRPYYRSAYAFVTRASGIAPASFDDPRLRALRIGVQVPGGDFSATAPGHALAARGAIDGVVGFPLYGERPAAARMVDALATGAIDLAIVWGPQAGWWAGRAAVPLRVDVAPTPAPGAGERAPPFEFSISVGVRRGDEPLRRALDAALERRRADIDAILAGYAVPRVDRPAKEAR